MKISFSEAASELERIHEKDLMRKLVAIAKAIDIKGLNSANLGCLTESEREKAIEHLRRLFDELEKE